MVYFTTGFQSIAQLLLLLAGGLSAALLFLAATALAVILAGSAFDLVTRAAAKRWERKGKQPRGRLGRIILEHYRRERDSPK